MRSDGEIFSESLGPGGRLAGFALIVNGLFGLAAMGIEWQGAGGGFIHLAQSGGVDLVIGTMLAIGDVRMRKWALLRLAAGTVFGAVLFASQRDVASLVGQLAFAASLIALLVGEAGLLRLGGAAAILLVYFVANGKSLARENVGRDPLAVASGYTKGELLPVIERRLDSASGGCIEITKTGWWARSEKAMRRDDPGAEVWISRPDYDAHVVVKPYEPAPDPRLGRPSFDVAVLSQMHSDFRHFRVLSSEVLPDRGVRIRGRGLKNGVEIEEVRTVLPTASGAVVLSAFARPAAYDRVRAEMDRVVGSFRVNCPPK